MSEHPPMNTPPWPSHLNGQPYGYVEGRDGVAAIFVILDNTGNRPAPEVLALLAELALTMAEKHRDADA